MQQNMNIKEQAKLVKIASPLMAGTSEELRNKALKEIAIELENHKEDIFDGKNIITEHEKMFSDEGIKIKALISNYMLK